MKIPFVDLQAQYASIKRDIDEAIAAVIRDSAFVGGRYVDAFEREFAEYCGTRYAVGISNGTDALRLALLACGAGPGDEVITVPNTFIATSEAITMTGATTRFVDVSPATATMDPARLEEALGPRTKAVIPVHLYGHPADMEPILEAASRRGVKVVADAAQAHGAAYRGHRIGVLGEAACFSFYPGKNLGAYGDAGAVVTDRREVAERIRLLRDHGRIGKYAHAVEAFSCRLDGMQAAILSAKLPHVEKWTESRRRHAELYTALLSDVKAVGVLAERPDVRAVYHLYVVTLERRDEVRARLERAGIACGVHYPIPLHRQPAYRRLALPEGSFPVAEELARTALSLPMYPELTQAQIEHVVSALRAAVAV